MILQMPTHSAEAPATIPELQKSQTMRLIDVFFVGPALIYYGMRSPDPLEKLIVGGIGAATIIYNGRNYLQNRF